MRLSGGRCRDRRSGAAARADREWPTKRQFLFIRRFHLAVLGHFKRGKSTFINALLGGAPILPAG